MESLAHDVQGRFTRRSTNAATMGGGVICECGKATMFRRAATIPCERFPRSGKEDVNAAKFQVTLRNNGPQIQCAKSLFTAGEDETVEIFGSVSART